MKPTPDTTTASPMNRAMARIGEQVDRLIVPDFRPLRKLLHDHIRGTAQEQAEVARQIEQTQAAAMAAATQLMLSREAEWQREPQNYFERLEYRRRSQP